MHRTKRYGIALDIGTTTLAGALVDVSGKKVLGTLSLPNPQSRWGADVISRINAVTEKPLLLKRLTGCVIDASNSIISKLLDGSALKKGELREIAAAGNSVMEHILRGISPGPMGKIPYRPVFKEAARSNARLSGFNVPEEVTLYTFPLIGGFVGGDSVAVALATGLAEGNKKNLAIDIGTNSEIMISARGRLFASSAAAGPAFEGGNIRCGMTARSGAISSVQIEDDSVRLGVIGGMTPEGICGSGIIDAVSELLKYSVIEPSGRIKNPQEVPTNLAGRIKKEKDGNSFTLFTGASGNITVSQGDLRALQVAKAAIRAGIKVLLEKAGIRPQDIGKIFIAGAFGSQLKKESLERIGLIEKEWGKKTEGVGDAVLTGAAMTLFSDDYKDKAEKIAEGAKYVPLSGSKLFEREFIKNMNFN